MLNNGVKTRLAVSGISLDGKMGVLPRVVFTSHRIAGRDDVANVLRFFAIENFEARRIPIGRARRYRTTRGPSIANLAR